MVYGKDRNVKRAYCADYALVKEITLSDLNAASPNTLIESMIIVCKVMKNSKSSYRLDRESFRNTNLESICSLSFSEI